MTDEEKAEEYKESKRLHCIPKERYVIEAQESRLAEIKQAFLAGLKVNVKELSTETLLKELIDRKVIRSWYHNGTYHVGNELPEEE